MKKNSKKFKKIAPALLVGLIAVGGASAWISTKETQTGINKIKTGTMTLKFIDTKDVDPNGKTRAETVINLSGNDMIPMTEKFANDTLAPYNFTLKNSGSVDLKYNLYLVKEESNFEPNVLSVDIDGANNSYTGVDNSERQLLTTGELKAGEHKTYDKFILFADENQEVANMINGGVGNTAKFHLEIDAVQVNGEFDTPTTPGQTNTITYSGNVLDPIYEVEQNKDYVFGLNIPEFRGKTVSVDPTQGFPSGVRDAFGTLTNTEMTFTKPATGEVIFEEADSNVYVKFAVKAKNQTGHMPECDGIVSGLFVNIDGVPTTLYLRGAVANSAKFKLKATTPPQETITLNTADKIEIEGKEYTVIENVQGNQYKVLATDTFQRRFNASFDEYVNSEIATYLDNDYFDTLPESIRNAIVETAIQQKTLKTWNNNNPTDWDTPKNAGTHKVFIPSWDEVTKIYGTTPDGLKAYALNRWTWLRDTYSCGVLGVYNNGNLGGISLNGVGYVRPAFVIDLSKVEFTKK